MNKVNLLRSIFAGLIFLPIAGLADSCPSPESINFENNTQGLGLFGGYKPIPPSGWKFEDESPFSTNNEMSYNKGFQPAYPQLTINPQNGILLSVYCWYYHENGDEHYKIQIGSTLYKHHDKIYELLVLSKDISSENKTEGSLIKEEWVTDNRSLFGAVINGSGGKVIFCNQNPITHCKW